jgi:ABC-type lipoprotein export system ATPase subunit
MRSPWRRKGETSATQPGAVSDETAGPLIDVRQVVKTYHTAAGPFTALKGVDLRVNPGEFVAVIGKSGSGKSTLVNMITGIDRPSQGQVYVSGKPVHTFSEGQMAEWRGRHMGVIFQFFQLLPTLTAAENVMLPMDFCNMYAPRQRLDRAMTLLEQVQMAGHAGKLPSALSGGEQQRIAIARALANDPAIIVADEPTGNLDSRTAESVFHLFEDLVKQNKTLLMVTHDHDLARRVSRTVLVADGEIIEEYLARTFPKLNEPQLVWATRQLRAETHEAGAVIVRAGGPPEKFYMINRGRAEVVLEQSSGDDIIVATLERGQYFGEIELMRGGGRLATIRATDDAGVELSTLDRPAFMALISQSQDIQEELGRVAEERLAENIAGRRGVNGD